jgi:hypothetical protein
MSSAPKGQQDLAQGFYEAELVKAALQKSIFLKYCFVWTRSDDKRTMTGSLVLDRHGARDEHRWFLSNKTALKIRALVAVHFLLTA